MVSAIFCPPSRPSIKELEDPLDIARGFRMAFRESDRSNQFSDEYLFDKKEKIEQILKSLDGAEAEILKELEAVTFVKFCGKEISINTYTTAIQYLISGALTLVSVGGVTASSSFSEEGKDTGIIATVIGVATAGLTFFLNKTKTFEKNAKNREDKLKILVHYIDPYKDFFSELLEKVDASEQEEVQRIANRTIKTQESIADITEEDGAIAIERVKEKRKKNTANLSNINIFYASAYK